MQIVLLITGLLILYFLNLEPGQDQDNGMIFFKNLTSYNVTGLNIPKCGFWVSTRNRDLEAIKKTVDHETLHELINQDYKHFCEVD